MKKNLLGWFAMATMLVGSGCSSDEVVNDYSPENAIQFGTYVGRGAESRAVIVNEKELAKNGFGVFAYYTQGASYDAGSTFLPNFMNNQKITATYTDSDSEDKIDYAWTYTPVKYWPNNTDDRVSFIAYAPYEESKTLNSSTGKLSFEVQENPKDQKDLVWAKDAHLNLQKQNVDSKVLFNFAHALSRIGFKLSIGEDVTTKANGDLENETTIYVDKVELSDDFVKSGKLDLTAGTATWNQDASKIGFTLDYVKGNVTDTELQNYERKGIDEDAEEEKPLNRDDSYLMIIPNNTTFTLTVTYRVFTKDAALTDEVAEQPGEKGSLVKNVIPVSITQNFVAGNAYTYNIILGMTSVKVDAEVGKWTDVPSDYWFNENKD